MDNALQQLCKDKKYCVDEMMRIREMWGSKDTFTEKNIDGARYSLACMLLYAPDELQVSLNAMINEMAMRESYLFFRLELTL